MRRMRELRLRAKLTQKQLAKAVGLCETTVRNIEAWYSAFDAKPGQHLYLAPPERVRVW